MRTVQLTTEQINETIRQNKSILKGVEKMLKENKEALKILHWSKSNIDDLDDCGDTELISLKKKLGVKVAKVTGLW